MPVQCQISATNLKVCDNGFCYICHLLMLLCGCVSILHCAVYGILKKKVERNQLHPILFKFVELQDTHSGMKFRMLVLIQFSLLIANFMHDLKSGIWKPNCMLSSRIWQFKNFDIYWLYSCSYWKAWVWLRCGCVCSRILCHQWVFPRRYVNSRGWLN